MLAEIHEAAFPDRHALALEQVALRGGAHGVVDGDPTEDLHLLQGQGKSLKVIMKDGKIFKSELR